MAVGGLALRLVLFVMLDNFLNNEVQKFLGKFRIKIGLVCKLFQPRNLRRFAGRVGRGQIVLSAFSFPTACVCLKRSPSV